MSVRTIVEINHDYLYQLIHQPEQMELFLKSLGGSEVTARTWEPNGVRILRQRHHSEKITLEVE